jgi:HK97 family phage major capsid protein
MPTALDVSRQSITLPVDVSSEILQKTKDSSAIMKLARKIALPGRGTSINVITSDPEAAWVGETASKPVSKPGLATKVMQAYKLAVIVPFSMEFKRDVTALYDALIERLPSALGKKFDATVFGGAVAPGSNFDTFANVTAQSISGTGKEYGALVAADTDVATHGGILNGWVLSPQGKGALLAAVDNNKRPLFINNVADGAVPVILGARTELSKGAYVAGSPDVLGFGGDWNQALYGTVDGVQIAISEDATLTYTEGTDTVTINLFQQNMFAVRAEIEVGFRADTSVFNAITE